MCDAQRRRRQDVDDDADVVAGASKSEQITRAQAIPMLDVHSSATTPQWQPPTGLNSALVQRRRQTAALLRCERRELQEPYSGPCTCELNCAICDLTTPSMVQTQCLVCKNGFSLDLDKGECFHPALCTGDLRGSGLFGVECVGNRGGTCTEGSLTTQTTGHLATCACAPNCRVCSHDGSATNPVSTCTQCDAGLYLHAGMCVTDTQCPGVALGGGDSGSCLRGCSA